MQINDSDGTAFEGDKVKLEKLPSYSQEMGMAMLAAWGGDKTISKPEVPKAAWTET